MFEAAEGKEGLPRVEPRGLVSHQSAGLQNLQMIFFLTLKHIGITLVGWDGIYPEL